MTAKLQSAYPYIGVETDEDAEEDSGLVRDLVQEISTILAGKDIGKCAAALGALLATALHCVESGDGPDATKKLRVDILHKHMALVSAVCEELDIVDPPSGKERTDH